MTDPLEILDSVLAKARAAGADQADAVFARRESQSVSVRLGEQEALDRSETTDIGLRVFVGDSPASASSSDLSDSAMDLLVRSAVDMARAGPPDPYACLAPKERLFTGGEAAQPLSDDTAPSAQEDIDRARAAEDAARAVEGVSNSQGASSGWSRSCVALGTSNGFSGLKHASSYSISAAVLAKGDSGMERDYASSSKRFFEDLESPHAVGQKAGARAVARKNPSSLKTGPMPVVFDKRVSASLLGHLSGAINGSAIARGTSFLRDAMNTQVFAKGINIIDDPHRHRGLRSRLFDGEGVATQQMGLVEDGMLTSWLLDCATAKQLGLETTGHAARGAGGPPSPSTSNFYVEAGSISVEDMLNEAGTGLYITEMIGMGVNQVTGDYSRGASGFAIVDGALAYPVSGLTVAGNLKDMFLNLVPADDLEFRYGTNAPTVRVDGMTVAGDA
ncbi:MAG: TldD/PmbA family protein [Pseudomonadota bacterium]